MCLAYSSVPVSAAVVTKREQPVELMLGDRDGAVDGDPPSRVSMQAQWRAFPTSSPRTVLLVGAALLAMVSSNRRSIGSRFPRHPHYLAVAIFPEVRQFPISRLKRRRPRRQRPPALFGAGKDGRTWAPDRRPFRACLHRVQHRGNTSTGYRIAHF